MAVKFVRSPGAGATTGANWPNAYANLGRYLIGVASSTSNDTVYVAHDHNFAYGSSLTLAFSSGTAQPANIMVVNDSTLSTNYTIAHTPLASSIVASATAIESVSSAGSTMTITGSFNMQGMKFLHTTGAGANMSFGGGTAVDLVQRMKNCTFICGGTGANTLVFGQASAGISQKIEMYDCSAQLANNTGAQIQENGAQIIWNGGQISGVGTTQPTSIFIPVNLPLYTQHRDLTTSTLTGNIVDTNTRASLVMQFRKCVFNTTSVFAISNTSETGAVVQFYSCGTPTTNKSWQFVHQQAVGIAQSDGAFYNNTGATDGTDRFSIKVTATAGRGIAYGKNLRFKLCDAFWTTNYTKMQFYALQRQGQTRINDSQFWVEAEFVNSNTAAPGVVFTNKVTDYNFLDAGTAWNTDTTNTWTGTTSPVLSYAEITPSSSVSGPMSLWGVLTTDNSAVSSEIWIDPLPKFLP